MVRSFEDDAVLLRAIDYRDTDRILTLYLRDGGRISAIARGARASKRRFGGSLQPFAKLRVEYSPGRELATLRGSTIASMNESLLHKLSCIQSAGEGTALVRDLCVDAEPEVRLFDAVVRFYEELGHGPDEEALTLAFMTRALCVSGLSPALDQCMVSGVRRPAGQGAYFDAVRGGIVRRELLGGAHSALALSGSALERMRESTQESWVPDAPWSAGEHQQIRRALTSFREAHVRAPRNL
ncbi:MAG: DNA repair protein RecO (recombination protein O) [Polyangiales bacterium]|jgi:DNA repair protein RecO (recombination protein O)